MSAKLKVVIADASGLIYSDDYREGWTWGFRGIGCDVTVVDIGILSRIPYQHSRSPYSNTHFGRTSKMLAQSIVALKPDLIFCHHGRAASRPEFIDYVKRAGAKIATYLCDEPYECGETAKYSPRFDLVFTMDPCTMRLHRDARGGKEGVFYLPPGVNGDRFKYQSADRTVPALFLGNASLVPRPAYLKQIENLVPGTQILFWETVGKGNKRWVPIERHAELFGSALLGLNVHRDPRITEECWRTRIRGKPENQFAKGIVPVFNRQAEWGTGFWNDGNLPAAHVNPRFFEMAACGACVINDDARPELARMFPMAPRAATPERFLELALYYLQNKEPAVDIGVACSSLILKRHTYLHRAGEVLIRAGLTGATVDSLSSLLGAPQEWLTLQDFNELGVNSSLEPTGLYGPFDPHSGKLSISRSGGPKSPDSLHQSFPWSP